MAHIPLRQTWLKKQSLSTRQVSIQFPATHFSLSAHPLSDLQLGTHRPSLHNCVTTESVLPSTHSLSRAQAVGMRIHSLVALPVNPAEQEQTFLCEAARQTAFIPHPPERQGSIHRPLMQDSELVHSTSDWQAGLQLPP